MMTSPFAYRKHCEKMPYLKLMRERDRLVSFLQQFEANELSGDRSDPEGQCCPGPEVRYQVYFEYLVVLCGVMQKRYNEEYVFGDRTLQQDAKAYRDAGN